jgi:hypothetical protein
MIAQRSSGGKPVDYGRALVPAARVQQAWGGCSDLLMMQQWTVPCLP